jgi:hypothetical protein
MTAMGIPARRLSLRAHFGPDRHTDALPILYVALYQGDPFGTGVEPSSTGGYARVAINNDGTLWGTVAAGQTSILNLVPVVWPVATGLWSITTPLDYWAVFDNAAGGNLWYAGPLSVSGKIIITGAGDQARLPTSAWSISQAG